LRSDSTGFILICRDAIARDGDHRGIDGILQSAVGSVPHPDVDGEPDHPNEHCQAESRHDCDYPALTAEYVPDGVSASATADTKRFIQSESPVRAARTEASGMQRRCP
jgi:hypothetical protein